MPISDVTTKGLDLSSSKASVYENSPVKHDLPKRQQCFSDTSLRATFMGVPVASISRSSSLWHFSSTGVTEQSNLRQYFSFFSLKQQASLLAYSERFPFFGRDITSHLQVFEDQYWPLMQGTRFLHCVLEHLQALRDHTCPLPHPPLGSHLIHGHTEHPFPAQQVPTPQLFDLQDQFPLNSVVSISPSSTVTPPHCTISIFTPYLNVYTSALWVKAETPAATGLAHVTLLPTLTFFNFALPLVIFSPFFHTFDFQVLV